MSQVSAGHTAAPHLRWVLLAAESLKIRQQWCWPLQNIDGVANRTQEKAIAQYTNINVKRMWATAEAAHEKRNQVLACLVIA